MDGSNLADWVAAGRTADLKTALDLAIQFCHGLEHAHGHGMIHRDIKPENVLITKEGQLKITDFGIVRIGAKDDGAPQPAAAGNPVPAEGTVIGIGTEDYMAPEQWLTGQLDARADLFAFGVCLYEMLCGRRPYEKAVGPRQEAPEPAALRRDQTLPASLCELMKRCVDWAPQNRPATAKELREELCDIYEQQFKEPSAYAELPQFSVAAAALNNRALSYLVLGKAEEAEQAWQAALEADPRHVEAVYNYGLHLWRTARLTDGALIRHIEEASADRPTDWLPKLLRAQVYLESGDGESAKRVLEHIAASDAQRQQVLSAKRVANELVASCGQTRTFEGHTDSVHSVCISTDGRYALSGENATGTLTLWDVATGQCLRSLTGHTGGVNSVCLSTDSQYALSGGKDKTLKLWDVATGQSLRTFTGHTNWVTSVCLSTDGRYALSGSWDNTLKLWDVATGQCLRSFTGHTWVVHSVYLSADDRYALSGSGDETLRLWDIATGQCLRSFTHNSSVNSVCLWADSRYALSGSSDNMLKLWDVATGQCLRIFTGHINGVNSVCLCADGRYALSGGEDNTLKLWNVATGQCLRSFIGHTARVTSVCLGADGRYALSGSKDRAIKFWTVPTVFFPAALQPSQFTGSEEAIQAGVDLRQSIQESERALARGNIGPAYRALQAARVGNYRRHPDAVEAWSQLYTRMRKANLQEHWKKDLSGEEVRSCCFSADGRYALSGDWDKTLKLWDVATGQCVRSFNGHTGVLCSVCLSADGCYALSGSWDDTLKLWDVATGQCLRTFTEHTDAVRSVCIGADGRYALSGSDDETLRLWDIATGQCLRTFYGHIDRVHSVSLSADGHYALSGSSDNTLKLWDVATGWCLRTFTGHTQSVREVCLSADGRYALSGSDDETLRLWDIATGRCLHSFKGHTDFVTSACLSADGRYVLSGSGNNALKLWNVATGQCLRAFDGHSKEVESVRLSADGRYVLSAGADGLKLWSLDWKLEENEPADWDEGARPYLQVFLRAQQPYAAALPQSHTPSEEEITTALTRTGGPVWTEDDFKRLLYTLGCAGYGWVRPEGIRRELEAMRQRPETFDNRIA